MTIAVGELYQVEHFVTFYIGFLITRTKVHVEVNKRCAVRVVI